MSQLVTGILLLAIAHVLTWFQMNSQFSNEWIKNNTWFMALCSVPIGWLFILSVRCLMNHYGELWPGRIIGFCFGNVVFAILTYLFMNEGITPKTIVSLVLSGVIIAMQVLWK